MSKPKILRVMHVIPSLGKGGAERQVLDICRQLKNQGVEVQLVLLNSLNEYKVEYPDVEYAVANCFISLKIIKKSKIDVGELQKIIDRFKPDVIHSHLYYAEVTSRATTYPQAKWFSHLHDNMHQLSEFRCFSKWTKKKITNWWERRWLLNRYRINGGTSFICISKDGINFLNSIGPIFKKYLLPNSIDLNNFHRRQRKYVKGRLHLINIGSFVENKNQHFLIDIVSILKKSYTDVKLTFLGDGELLPIVSTDAKGNRQLINNGSNGFLIQQGSGQINTFISSIDEIMKSETSYQQFSKNAFQFAQNFGMDNYVKHLKEIYTK